MTATTERVSSGSNLGPTNPDLLSHGRRARRRLSRRATAWATTSSCPSTRSRRRAQVSIRTSPCATPRSRRLASPPSGAWTSSDVLALVDDVHGGSPTRHPRRPGRQRAPTEPRPRRHNGRVSERRRGSLRIYLGAAPGVGKTFAMLNEGRRRCERGADVVVGLVETHGRQRTADQIGDLEVVPRRTVEHRGSELTEMDVDAILRRHPDLVLVDELAHSNAPGSRNEKRWADVDELLDAGIDVISTVNIQHLESLNDVVERITGIRQRETIPDHAVRRRRPDRARRHGARGAAPPPRPRQRLRPGEGRRRPRQLLPAGQPVGAARAGPALGRRPRRRRPAGLPRAPRHHPPVGDARTRRRRPRPARPGRITSSAARHASPSGRRAS